MDQAKSRKVEKGSPFLRPPKLSREAFKALIEQRGWRMADVACRWSIRPEHLSRIAADEDRDLKWDDLVRSLPALSSFERSCVTAARLSIIPPKPRRRKDQPIGELDQPVAADSAGTAVQPDPPFKWEQGDDEDEDEPFAPGVDGFRYNSYLSRGSELVVVQEIDGFAREHAILVVTATRVGVDPAGGAQEEYQCESATGDRRWIAPDQIDDWLVSNGKMRDLR
ncbi:MULTISPECIES: hypothetical protein [Pseudomonas]|uniref:Uncharacterized protein n=2 Tax=Pseudomonas TaxID=286 RepID=A0A7X1L0K3_9PSED|nr:MULTISPECIES: hypothetical protein [Pseudomonas]MBC2693550.1 hypothetical protein [Pseudomonas kielensis]MDD1011028.1 hypothetical protein [Pseudomonas shahriarae]